MRKTFILMLLSSVLMCSCKQDAIDNYAVENSAINFNAPRNALSLKGVTAEKISFSLPFTLVGPVTDYDRELTLDVKDSTAVLGRDFKIVSAVLPAGKSKGNVMLEINNLPEGVTSQAAVISLVPNQHFIAGIPLYQSSVASWSEEYERPNEGVWYAWYLFFCKGYSKDFHRLLVEIFGPEIETFVNKRSYAENDPSLVFKMPDWWYAANSRLYEVVREHDTKNPSDPYRHSDDYELYSSYQQAVGAGTKPDTPPTILSTLNSI